MSWNTRGLRGSTFEEMINRTNEAYAMKGLAVVQKIPTPITPVRFDQNTRTISLAYFDQKSTVDYIGAVQGIPICFDAKETGRGMLPIQNIHEHQIQFMKDFEKQDGLSFLIVHFTKYDEYFYLPFEVLYKYWKDSQSGGRKSIPYDGFDRTLMIQSKNGFYIHYLQTIKVILQRVNKGDE